MAFDFNMEPGRRLFHRNVTTDEKPLVSIITPFYNAGRFLEQTYNCILNQTFPWLEWIIVDDGSTNTKDLDELERIAKTDERIRVFHKESH